MKHTKIAEIDTFKEDVFSYFTMNFIYMKKIGC